MAGSVLLAQDKRGALAISPTIVKLVGKHGVIHSSLILIPDVDFPVGIVSEAPLAPLVVHLPVLFLGGRCCLILHLGWFVIVVLLGGMWDVKVPNTAPTLLTGAEMKEFLFGKKTDELA